MLLTHLLLIIIIISVVFAIDISCPFDSDYCNINCTSINGVQGCFESIINASTASSLSLICSSSSRFGGCQDSVIYCPINGQCNILCEDDEACMNSKIYASHDINIKCNNMDGTCYNTTLFAEMAQNVHIECQNSVGLWSPCSFFDIYAYNVSNITTLSCIGDFTCDSLNLFLNFSKSINIYARGLFALSSTFIYGLDSQSMMIFCEGDLYQYACDNVSIYLPQYQSLNQPRFYLDCQGFGCASFLNLYAINGFNDVNISWNGCNQCQSSTECLGNISMFSNDNYSDTTENIFDAIHTNLDNDISKCSMFESDFQCKSDIECIIDCRDYGDDGCYDKIINGQNASSLQLICIEEDAKISGCGSSHVFCPINQDSQCHIQCLSEFSCSNMIITTNEVNSLLNITCSEWWSCSYMFVFAVSANSIHINCLNSINACINMNIDVTRSNDILMICQGNTTQNIHNNLQQSHVCDSINIIADQLQNELKFLCSGNNSCYSPKIKANKSNIITIESFGSHAIYNGILHFETVQSLSISCSSLSDNSSCYNLDIYLPLFATNLVCEGYGCSMMNLFALNGLQDIINFTMNGCDVCSSIDDCIFLWNMHCGQSYQTLIEFTGNDKSCNDNTYCQCNDFLNLIKSEWHDNKDKIQCSIFEADLICLEQDDCHIMCIDIDCKEKIIDGMNAKSLTVTCNDDNCQNAEIYCPNECKIICSGYHSCFDIQIYGDKDCMINVECIDAYSCGSMDIYADDAALIDISCDSTDACHSLVVFGSYSKNISIECTTNTLQNISIDKSHSSCPYMTIHSEYVSDVIKLICNGEYACVQWTIYVDNANNIIMEAIGDYSLHTSTIYSVKASSLKLSCFYGCYDNTIYIPENNNVDLLCVGYGCAYMNLFIENEITDTFNMTFTGCAICNTIDDCIDNWIISCSIRNYLYGTTCASYYCGCRNLLNVIQNAWIHGIIKSNQLCINNRNQYQENSLCKSESDCSLNDDNDKIQQQLINAQLSTSLFLQCNLQNSCSSTVVYCPNKQDSLCKISCIGMTSCENLQIISKQYSTILDIECGSQSCNKTFVYSPDTHHVNLQCVDSWSCTNLIINAINSLYLDIECNGKYSCHLMNIEAIANSGNISLKCFNEYSCNELQLDSSNANNIYILGDDTIHGLYSANIWAQNASNILLECKGKDEYYGCYHLYVYFPSKSAKLSCWGYGCQEIYFTINNSSHQSFELNLNDCNVCDKYDTCISSWRLSCHNPGLQYTIFDGSSCHTDKCQCNQLFLINYQSSSKQTCFVPTYAPTFNPTQNSKPSIYNTTSSLIIPITTMQTTSFTKVNGVSLPKGTYIIIVIVIIIIIIGLVYCCIRYRKNYKINKMEEIAAADPSQANKKITGEGREGVPALIGMQPIKTKTRRKRKKKVPYVQLDDKINNNKEFEEGFVE